MGKNMIEKKLEENKTFFFENKDIVRISQFLKSWLVIEVLF